MKDTNLKHLNTKLIEIKSIYSNYQERLKSLEDSQNNIIKKKTKSIKKDINKGIWGRFKSIFK
jgi:flagellar biosynthesis chaperone FliJ